MATPTTLDLEEVAWMRRELPSAAAAVLLGRTRLYAGDHDGGLAAWAEDGELLWRTEQRDRVMHMAGARDASPPVIAAACGNEVVVLEAATGEQQWRHELEGSADLVRIQNDGSEVVATSSVYDIEHGDFMESACWRFDDEGNLLHLERFDERPWHLRLDEDGRASLALGRPRCGVMVLERGQRHPTLIEQEQPFLAGTDDGDMTLLGSADGALRWLRQKDGKPRLVPFVDIGRSPVSAIVVRGDDVVHAEEDGEVWCHDRKGGLTWRRRLDLPIVGLSHGPGEGHAGAWWVAGWNDPRSALWVLSPTTGEVIARFEIDVRVTSFDRRDERLAVGLDDGRVLLFQDELFARRLEQAREAAEPVDEDAEAVAKRRALMERLRQLRS